MICPTCKMDLGEDADMLDHLDICSTVELAHKVKALELQLSAMTEERNNERQIAVDWETKANVADRLISELQKKLELEEAAHEKTIIDRDGFEEALTQLANYAGCQEEWSNLHAHGDCITNEWADRVEKLRKALERYAAGCDDCKGDKAVDCYCGYARAALKETQSEKRVVSSKKCGAERVAGGPSCLLKAEHDGHHNSGQTTWAQFR